MGTLEFLVDSSLDSFNSVRIFRMLCVLNSNSANQQRVSVKESFHGNLVIFLRQNSQALEQRFLPLIKSIQRVVLKLVQL